MGMLLKQTPHFYGFICHFLLCPASCVSDINISINIWVGNVYIFSTLLAALKWRRVARTLPSDEGYCWSTERAGSSPSKLHTDYWQPIYWR